MEEIAAKLPPVDGYTKEETPSTSVYNPATRRELNTSFRTPAAVKYMEAIGVEGKKRSDYFGMEAVESHSNVIKGVGGVLLKTPIVGSVLRYPFELAAKHAAIGTNIARSPEEFDKLNPWDKYIKALNTTDFSKINEALDNTNRAGKIERGIRSVARGVAEIPGDIFKFGFESMAVLTAGGKHAADPKFKEDPFVMKFYNSFKDIDFTPLKNQMKMMDENTQNFYDAAGIGRTGEEGFWSNLTEGLTQSVSGSLALARLTKIPKLAGLNVAAMTKQNLQREIEDTAGYKKAQLITIPATMASAAIEYMSIESLWKATAGAGFMKKFAEGVLHEGIIEEGSQGVIEELARKVGGIDNTLPDVIKNIAASIVVGGVVGGSFKVMEGSSIKDLQNLGFSAEDAKAMFRAVSLRAVNQETVNGMTELLKNENSDKTYEGGTFTSGLDHFKKAIDPETLKQEQEQLRDTVGATLREGGFTNDFAELGIRATQTLADNAAALGMSPLEYWEKRNVFINDVENKGGTYIDEEGNLVENGKVLFQELETYDAAGNVKTESPEFKAWFGDSKVVNEAGKPLIVYHGTDAKFDIFDISLLGENAGSVLGEGFYFTMNKDIAPAFGKNIMPVYLNMQNPYIIKHSDGLTKDIFNNLDVTRKQIAEEFGSDTDGQPTNEATTNFLKSQGYDGVIRDDQYLAFEPTQIKSVDNKGTFDSSNPNIFNQFAGRQAVSANKKELARAMAMEDAGATREEMLKETGWFRGSDGKWRFEISDAAAKLKNVSKFYNKKTRKGTMTLGDALDHEQLYEAYPFLRDVGLVIGDLSQITDHADEDTTGFVDRNTIYLRDTVKDDDTSLKILLHEIQHFIQYNEGFARGGTVQEFRDNFKDVGAKSAADAYKRLAGEIEARNAASRRFIKQKQLRSDIFTRTQDVSEDEAIIVFDNGTEFKVSLAENVKTGTYNVADRTINLITPNKTTRAHELLGHHVLSEISFLNEMSIDKMGKNLPIFEDTMNWLGSPDNNGTFSRDQHEKFADGMVKFLQEGVAPTARLKELFIRIAELFKDIYEKGLSLNVELSDSARKLYGDILKSPYVDEEVFFQESLDDIREINAKLEKGSTLTEEELTKIKEVRDIVKQKIPKDQDFLSFIRSRGGYNLDKMKGLDVDQMRGLKDTKAFRGILNNKSDRSEQDLVEDYIAFTGVQQGETYETNLYDEATAYLEEALDFPKFAEGIGEAAANIRTEIDEIISKTGIDLSLINDRIKQAERFTKREQREMVKQNKALLRINKKNLPKFIAENIDRMQKSDMTVKQKNFFERQMANAQSQLEMSWILQDLNDSIYHANARSVKSDLNTIIQGYLRTSKPVKEGQRSVGKYDYETNAIFNKLREYNAYNQEEAFELLDAINGVQAEDQVELSVSDDIMKRFLTYKAKGQKGGVELYTQVAEDMRYLTETGKVAKDSKEFEDMVNKKERVDAALAGISKTKGDAESLKTKAANKLLSSTGNLEAYLTAGFGNDFMEKWTLLGNEKNEFTAISKDIKNMIANGTQIYGLKDNNLFLKHVQDMGRETNTRLKKIKSNTRGVKLSKLMIMDIYNAVKNKDIRDDYYRVYGKEQIDGVTRELSDADKLFANDLMQTLKNFHPKVNNIFVQLFNRDMPRIKDYWTSSADKQSVTDLFTAFIPEQMIPGFSKQRARTREPYPTNAFNKVVKYVNNAEYMDNVSLKYRDLTRILEDTDVKESLIEKRGEDYYRGLKQTLQNSSITQMRRDMDATEHLADLLLGNWITAKIGANPDVFLKQLISTINYAEQMPTDKWVKGWVAGMANPKEVFDYMWKNSAYLRARFQNGYSEALQYAMNGVNNMPKAKNKWDSLKHYLTWTTRAGDIGAIVYGGYPLVKYYESQGMSTKEAFDKFEMATLRSQQSPLKSSLSNWQNSKNPAMRMLFSFANTPSQYARKIYQGVMDYQNGDIDKKQLAKIVTIYSVVNGAVYALEAALLNAILFDEPLDEDDVKGAVLQIALTPFGGIPIVRDAINTAGRSAMGLKTYNYQVPMITDLMDLSKDIGAGDFIDILKTGSELGAGVPVKKWMGIYEKAK